MNPNKTAELIDNINARLTESATLSRIAFIDLMAAGNDTSSKIHGLLLALGVAMVEYHEKADALWAKIEADNAKTTVLRNEVAKAMGGGL